MIFVGKNTSLSASAPRTAVFIAFAACQILLAACSGAGANANAQITQVQTAQPTAHAIEQASLSSYTVKRGDTTLLLARRFLSQSSLMTVAELDAAIRDANGLKKGAALKPGSAMTIPTLEKQPIVEKPRSAQKDADIRAVYLTGTMAGSVNGMNIVRRWREVGGNAVVFDIKDSDGSLSIPFSHRLAPKNRPSITNLPKYVRFLHSQHMHAIARIALFRDENIAQKHSELAVRSRSNPQEAWRENGKLVWTDSSNPEVQAYNIELAKFVAGSGADEIQFDYVRFPAEGNQKDAKFAFEAKQAAVPEKTDVAAGGSAKVAAHSQATERADVIANFLDKAYSELHPMGVLVSLDVFGIMAWQRQVDLSHTGQDIVKMAKHCDVLSPMIYPSHFFGMDGYAMPGDAPEHFISTSMARFEKITAGSGVVIRPWLQAFAWKTKIYSPQYIETQVLASKQQGGLGFLLWNARNDYAKPFAAMPTMVAAKDRYFGKRSMTSPATPVVAADAAAANPAPSQAIVLPESSAPSEAKPEPKAKAVASAPATVPQKSHH
ncbi:MAG: hypothetical protein JWO13_2204 [Acidobacteriales bacterium]|nr:hypothetical protein [Terriglobales bacterium]